MGIVNQSKVQLWDHFNVGTGLYLAIRGGEGSGQWLWDAALTVVERGTLSSLFPGMARTGDSQIEPN